MKKRLIPFLALAALLTGCSDHKSTDISGVALSTEEIARSGIAPARIVRLDMAAAAVAGGNELPDSLGAPFARWMEMSEAADASPAEFASSRRIAAFLPDVAKVFTTEAADSLAMRLGRVFDVTGSPRKDYTIVSPYRQSIVLDGDSAVYVALNHYLGADHPAYEGFPDYQRRLKVPASIAPDVAEALLAAQCAEAEISDPAAPTTLERMLQEGAIVEGMMRAAGISEQQALGFTDAQMQWAVENQQRVWETMMTSKLLFSTDPDVADRLLNPAPSVPLINQAAPGRIGRFIGHRIAAAYLAGHPDADLTTLLWPKPLQAAQAILSESGYQGK